VYNLQSVEDVLILRDFLSVDLTDFVILVDAATGTRTSNLLSRRIANASMFKRIRYFNSFFLIAAHTCLYAAPRTS